MEPLYLGIDIGGTNTYTGIVDNQGGIFSRENYFTKNFPDLSGLVAAVYKDFNKSKYFSQIAGIGIGVPNGNYFSGTIDNAPNLPWSGCVNVKQEFEKTFLLPVKVDNDANAAAQGEMIFGNARGLNDFLLITLGTGLGSGIVVNGQLLRGKSGHAGELGHLCIKINGRKCNCGKNGCLETYASATGIKRTTIEMLANYQGKSLLNNFSIESLSAKMIDEAAIKGDELAIKAFDKTAKYLGIGLANAAVLLYPEAIILAGGLSQAGNLLFDPLKNYFSKFLLPGMNDHIKIIPSGLKNNDAALLGAASLLF